MRASLFLIEVAGLIFPVDMTGGPGLFIVLKTATEPEAALIQVRFT